MIGIQLLDIFQILSSAGYTYNDLKLDNIIVGDADDENLHILRLIDFGFAQNYLNKDGSHIKEELIEQFRGNMIFSSIN